MFIFPSHSLSLSLYSLTSHPRCVIVRFDLPEFQSCAMRVLLRNSVSYGYVPRVIRGMTLGQILKDEEDYWLENVCSPRVCVRSQIALLRKNVLKTWFSNYCGHKLSEADPAREHAITGRYSSPQTRLNAQKKRQNDVYGYAGNDTDNMRANGTFRGAAGRAQMADAIFRRFPQKLEQMVGSRGERVESTHDFILRLVATANLLHNYLH
ncbi:hypothetical protein KIPB_006689 [Kipferlia bialata]|uniref:Uncharacterized protein n=1 Tax=Kipferlia bialata TaxID=797122 RepID=A0A9K3D007_9EUKA|nr:hypothetical protein KIPB_006689 [Kipferlia bialata]|eukprot:g6689.t1